MPTFNLEQTMPSCVVNKGLLSDIEAYLNIEMPKKLGEACGDTFFYNISIQERMGTETLSTMSEYTPSKFSDGTKRITVSWQNKFDSPCYLDIGIDFGSRSGWIVATITVRCTSPTARETVLGIKESIFRLLESHRTYNWVFNPRAKMALPFFSLVAFLALLPFGLSFCVKGEYTAGLCVFSIDAIIGWIWLSGAYLRPFISFDTRRQQLLNRLWQYFSVGVLGFICFGTLLPMVRKAILGF